VITTASLSDKIEDRAQNVPPGFRSLRVPERHSDSGKVPHPDWMLPAFCTTADLTLDDLNANAVHERDTLGRAGANASAMWIHDHIEVLNEEADVFALLQT